MSRQPAFRDPGKPRRRRNPWVFIGVMAVLLVVPLVALVGLLAAGYRVGPPAAQQPPEGPR